MADGEKKIVFSILFGFGLAILAFCTGAAFAHADFTQDIDRTPHDPATGASIYSTGTYDWDRVKQRYDVGADGYLREVHLALAKNTSNTSVARYRWGIYSDDDVSLYVSDYIAVSTLPTQAPATWPTETIFTIPQYNQLYFETGDHYFLVVQMENITDRCGVGAADWCVAMYVADEFDYTLYKCRHTTSTCTDTAYSGHSMWAETYVTTQDTVQEPPTLYSPTLPYVSSSTPIRFTTYSPEAGYVVCINLSNDWRQRVIADGSGSYSTFSVDMENGTNSIKCHSEAGTLVSEYLEFDLTFDNGSEGVPPPVFNETKPNFTYDYNPIRVSVNVLADGDLWCKKGSGSFVNIDSLLTGQNGYFDLDFTDIDPLENGLEYPVSCYLETEGGNSETVSQIYTYSEMGLCSPSFGSSTGDKGLILGMFSMAWGTILNTPVLGDLLMVDCIIYNNLYSNLVPVDTSDLTYHITYMGTDDDFTLPITDVKASLQSWVDGTGYSSIKSTITVLVWCLVMFGIFFKFIFPMIYTGMHDKAGTGDIAGGIESEFEKDIFNDK